MFFMVKALFTSLAFPYAFYPSANVSGDTCTSPCGIASLGLNGVVLRFADGASTHQFLFKMHDKSDSLHYKVKNRYTS